jgi:hypothetical protein
VGKSVRVYRSGTRVFLVLELSTVRADGALEIELLASVPGREEPMQKLWQCPTGCPDGPTLTDMSAYVEKLVGDATVSFCGVQRTLPLA